MAQPAHPQPQDDFPFLLFLTILAIETATAKINIALTTIVAIFSIIHASMEIPPVLLPLTRRIPSSLRPPVISTASPSTHIVPAHRQWRPRHTSNKHYIPFAAPFFLPRKQFPLPDDIIPSGTPSAALSPASTVQS